MASKKPLQKARDSFIIKTKNGKQLDLPLYGGDQNLFENEILRHGGCGLIAAANVLCALSGNSPDLEEYTQLCMMLYKKYIPVSRFGTDGIRLACGLSRAMRDMGFSYRARWCISMKKLKKRMEEMLSRGIPVILSAGPAFFKKGLILYELRGNALFPALYVRSHYVTVTEDRGTFLAVSSWGRKYYISKKEFAHFAYFKSSPVFSNIVYITGI
ncbi:MAG: hypothetical protein IKV97_06835 [Clostridia bacterium]|nr:hypothetical protein [Clostridia bacterium]